MKIFKSINMPENMHEYEDIEGIRNLSERLLDKEIATDIAMAIVRYLNYSIVKKVFTKNTLEYILQSCVSEDEQSEFYKIIRALLGDETIQSEILKKVINDRDVIFVDSESEADIIISLNMDEVYRHVKFIKNINHKFLTQIFPHQYGSDYKVEDDIYIYGVSSNISTGEYLNKVFGKDLSSEFNRDLDLDSDLIFDGDLTFRFVWHDINSDFERKSYTTILNWEDRLFLGINSSEDRYVIPYEQKVKIIESLSIKLNITLHYTFNLKRSMEILRFIKNNMVKELRSEIKVIVG